MSAAAEAARAARDVARRRAEKVREMRAALVRGDKEAALRLLRVYVGLDEESNEGDPADPGLH